MHGQRNVKKKKRNLVAQFLFFPHGATAPQWDRASLSRHHNRTQTHHTQWDSSGRVISPTQRPLPNTTQQLQEMSPAGFETEIPVSEWS